MVIIANVTRFVALALHNTGWQIWANTVTHLDAMAGGACWRLCSVGVHRKLDHSCE